MCVMRCLLLEDKEPIISSKKHFFIQKLNSEFKKIVIGNIFLVFITFFNEFLSIIGPQELS
jgi:hypothetical protein